MLFNIIDDQYHVHYDEYIHIYVMKSSHVHRSITYSVVCNIIYIPDLEIPKKSVPSSVVVRHPLQPPITYCASIN